MKPNCFFSRLDQSNFKNGYYKVLMELTEDTPRLASIYLRQFEEIIDFNCASFDEQLCWYAKRYHRQLAVKFSSREYCEEYWLTVSENQLPNLREEQQL
jgi:hypothetical protein